MSPLTLRYQESAELYVPSTLDGRFQILAARFQELTEIYRLRLETHLQNPTEELPMAKLKRLANDFLRMVGSQTIVTIRTALRIAEGRNKVEPPVKRGNGCETIRGESFN